MSFSIGLATMALPAKLNEIAWLDRNLNGSCDGEERITIGVTVERHGEDGTLLVSTTTRPDRQWRTGESTFMLLTNHAMTLF